MRENLTRRSAVNMHCWWLTTMALCSAIGCTAIASIDVAAAQEQVLGKVSSEKRSLNASVAEQSGGGKIRNFVVQRGDSAAQNGLMQIIYPDPLVTETDPGAMVVMDIIYDTAPQDATLTGIGVRVHYDSTRLSFDAVSETLASGRFFDPTLVASEPDSSDFDGDAATDRFILLAWVDFAGNWPGTLPAKLAAVSFVAAGDFTGSTQVNFSASDLAAGYEFSSQSASFVQEIIFADGFEGVSSQSFSN